MTDFNPDETSYVYISQFDAFTLYHLSQKPNDVIGAGLPALGHAISGASGTAVSKLITYPLDFIITRLQCQKQLQSRSDHERYEGILDAVKKIYTREGGSAAFYTGVGYETLKGIADSFLFFLAYSYLRHRRLSVRGSRRSLPVLEEIGVGVIAGAFSKFFTTPIQQIVIRKQIAAMVKQDRNSPRKLIINVSDISRAIFQERGLQGFWSGYSATLILTLNPSITMLLHKMLLRLLVPRMKRSNPGAHVTFFLAAISKALASTITYPLSLAKTRAQISPEKPLRVTNISKADQSTGISKSRAVWFGQSTIFSAILRIIQTEGLWALYEGLGAEVLKGFFSYGITMLIKDRIHAGIIHLYYTISQSMKSHSQAKRL